MAYRQAKMMRMARTRMRMKARAPNTPAMMATAGLASSSSGAAGITEESGDAGITRESEDHYGQIFFKILNLGKK